MRRPTCRAPKCLLVLLPFVAGCGAGSAAIASSGGGSTSVNADTPTQVVAVSVSSTRVSPAQVTFHVIDPELDTARVEVRYTTDGTFAGSTLIATRAVAGSGGAGTAVMQAFAFAGALGTQLTPNVLVFAVLEGRTDIDLGVNGTVVAFGNDAPAMAVDRSPVPPAAEASGPLPLNFTVTDSSNDEVRVGIEFTTNPNDPVPLWTPARPSGSAMTPAFAFGQVTALAGGTNLTFAWDTDADLGGQDVEVALRVVATELAAPGESTPQADGLTNAFRVDNNRPPEIAMDVVGFALNEDRSRTIPAPFVLSDEEDDEVQVLFQWRTQGGAFPALPADVDALKRVARDPEQRRALQIATERPRSFEVTVASSSTLETARLPELGTSAAILTSRHGLDPVNAMRGLELQVLRPLPLAVASQAWAGNLLVAPKGLVVAERGLGYVLDEAGGGGQWVVRELEIANGSFGAPIGGADTGSPNAIAAVPGSASLLVASDESGTWSVTRVDPLDDARTRVFTSDASLPAGPVRGILGRRGGERCFVTVGDALLEVAFPAGGPTSARAVLMPGVLSEPFGIAADPLDADVLFVAERGVGRVTRIDLRTLARSAALVASSPGALAFDAGGRLLVLTGADASGHATTLRTLARGLHPDSVVGPLVSVETVPAPIASLAAGEVGARVGVSPLSRAVVAGGGIEQVKTVTDYDPLELEVTVDPVFLPPVGRGRTCRLVEPATSFVALGASTSRTFVWDARDVPGTVEVELRAIAFDRDVGPVAASAPKSLRGALDGTPEVELGSAPLFAGDVDGDGDTDLVTGTALHLQDESGDFPFSVSLPASAELVADVDGDGRQDVIGGGNVHRLVGLSPPSFGMVPIPVGGPAEPVVAAGDVDRDGRLDLVLHSGTIRYQSSPMAFSSGPNAAQAGFAQITPFLRDGDGDGDLDVVFGDSTLNLEVQDAAGAFSSVQNLVPFVSFSAVDADGADLDLDGVNDFVVPEPFDPLAAINGRLTVAFSTAAGVKLSPPAGTIGFLGIELADIDGDGLRDLVAAAQGPVTSIFYQSARGAIRAEPEELGGLGGVSRHVADFDGDGTPDLAGEDLGGSSGVVLRARRPGTIDAAVGQTLGNAAPGSFDDCALGDFDGDGDLDVIGTDPVLGSFHVLDQVRPGVFESSSVQAFPAGGEAILRRVAVAELDGDGRVEFLIAADQFSSSPGILGSGAVFTAQADPASTLDLAAVDLDGSGTLEILRIASFGAQSELATWRLDAMAGTYDPIFPLPVPDVRSARVADLGNDGLGDLFVSDAVGIRVHRQTAPDVFSVQLVTAADSGAVILARDLDRDGRVDLVTSGSGTTRVYFQEPAGTFALSPTLAFTAIEAHVVDLGDDGHPDLLLRTASADVRTAKQVLPRQFVEDVPLRSLGVFAGNTGPIANAGAIADIDGDGELDAISAANTSIRTHFGGR